MVVGDLVGRGWIDANRALWAQIGRLLRPEVSGNPDDRCRVRDHPGDDVRDSVVRRPRTGANLARVGQRPRASCLHASCRRPATLGSVTLPSIRGGVAYSVTLTIACCLAKRCAVLGLFGNLFGNTQSATVYIHDGNEGFRTKRGHGVTALVATISFVLLVGMDAIVQKPGCARTETAVNLISTRIGTDLTRLRRTTSRECSAA